MCKLKRVQWSCMKFCNNVSLTSIRKTGNTRTAINSSVHPCLPLLKICFTDCSCVDTSITAPQDAHKRLVMQNGSLLHYISVQGKCQTWVDYITFSTGLKTLPRIYHRLQGKGAHKQSYRSWKKKVLPNVEDRTLAVRLYRAALVTAL